MDQRYYHYIRYAMLFAYLLALAQIPQALNTSFPKNTLKAFYFLLTVLAMIIDWRNFSLYRKELKTPVTPGACTIAIQSF
jgi:ABC-type uncharacterized transport system permease subunit